MRHDFSHDQNTPHPEHPQRPRRPSFAERGRPRVTVMVDAGDIAAAVVRARRGVPAVGEVRAAYSFAEMPPVQTLGS